MRRGIRDNGLAVGGAAILLLLTTLYQIAQASSKKSDRPPTLQQVVENKNGSVQLVRFPDTGWGAVKVVRGRSTTKAKETKDPAPEKAEAAEVVMFGDLPRTAVRVIRGETLGTAAASGQPHQANGMKVELVRFGDPRDRPISILRGFSVGRPTLELFEPASIADLDRVSFAVDGAESAHGADLRMWRSEPSGPQGPMQITAAAAFDVGGGNRFDLVENRALGRAYLARMYQRYGNWADAIAAYNWGPGNLDAWITGGRPTDRFPIEVERYRDRVLRDAVATGRSVLESRD